MSLETKKLKFLLNNLADINLEDFKKDVLLLAQGEANFNVYSDNFPYKTALHHLVLTNTNGVNDEAIKQLLQLKPNCVDAKNGYNRTALQALIQQAQSNQCDIEDFKRTTLLLATNGANLGAYAQESPYRTALQQLVLTNKNRVNDEAIKQLLKLNPGCVDAKNGYNRTALQALIQQAQSNQCDIEDFKRTTLLLATNGANLGAYAQESPYRTALQQLVLTNKNRVNDEAIKQLLKLNPGCVDAKNGYNRTALQALIQQAQNNQCDIEDFKRTTLLLASNGANLGAYAQESPYRTALQQLVLGNANGVNDEAITQLLKLNPGCVDAKNGYNRTALQALIQQAQNNQCSMEDFKRTTLLLAANGANLGAYAQEYPYRTALHHLVLTNENGSNNKEINKLVELKPDFFKSADGYNHLPLEALLHSKPKISLNAFKQAITSKGEEALSYRSKENKRTLLHVACSLGNLEIAEYLHSKGFDLNAKTSQGDTLLHVSAQSHKNQAIWQWLYKNKIDINVQNDKKNTALHIALQFSNKEMIEWLLTHNANPYIRDIKGNTAAALIKLKYPELVQFQSPQYKLYASIEAMREYGEHLKKQGAPKGEIVIELADKLYEKASSYFNQNPSKANFPEFQQEFATLLKSKNKEMSEYRTSWPTIIANVLLALTGVGAVLIVGKLLHSSMTGDRPLFFFQKPLTTSEMNVKKIGSVLEELEEAKSTLTYN